MRARLILAVFVLGGLTAFAPAPFPKKERSTESRLSLERLQGVWTVVKVEQSSRGGYQKTNDSLTEIRIDGARWTFVSGRGGPPQPGRSLELTVDVTKMPVWFDLGEKAQPQTTGIMRLRGDELHVLYQWGRPRPDSFENPPEGYWHVVFRRR